MLPDLQPVKMEAVQWQVVEVDGEPLFALTARGYESLSRNIADVARWMREASYQIKFYRGSQQPKGDSKPTTSGDSK